MGLEGLNSGPHIGAASILATEPYPRPLKCSLIMVSHIKISLTAAGLMILNAISLFLVHLGKMVVFENYIR